MVKRLIAIEVPDGCEVETVVQLSQLNSHETYAQYRVMFKEVYREPRMPGDYGKDIEVRDYSDSDWMGREFCGYRQGHDFPFVTERSAWKFARIKD
jgi:hypothetical protein